MSEAVAKPKNPKAFGAAGGHGFQKGRSGNPGGRMKGIEAEARKYTVEAIACLARSLKGETWQERHSAANLLLDRGWGKAAQQIAGDIDKPVAIHFSWAPASSVLEDAQTVIEHDPQD